MQPDTTYTVKPGDTLSKIASQYGTDIGSVTGYKSGDPNKIGVGEVLTIGGQKTAPANTIDAGNLGQTPYKTPPVVPQTGYAGLITSANSAITSITPTVDKGQADIKAKYDRLGDLPTEQANSYKTEGVYTKQAEYSRQVNTINQKELAYQTRIDKIRNENPTGQLTEGQQIAMDRLSKDWAVEKAGLSIAASFAKDDYTTAKQIVDDRVAAETEGIKNELDGLKYFYTENQDRLSDERKNLLSYQIKQVEDELAKEEERVSQIGAIQLAAAENGAPSNVIVAIGKANDITSAINSAGSWIDTTIDRKGSGGGTGSGLVDLAPEDERILTGAGFSSIEIKDIQKSVAQFGIQAVLNNITDETKKNAIRNVYGMGEEAKKFTTEDIRNGATLKKAQSWLKDNYTEQEIIKMARDGGTGSRRFWLDKGDSAVLSEYLNSTAAQEAYVKHLTEVARKAGRLQE